MYRADADGSMKGSGIDSYWTNYGTFVCPKCNHETLDAEMWVNDWGRASIDCEACEATTDLTPEEPNQND